MSNYQIFPFKIEVTNSNGSSMTLVGKNNPLASYWSTMGSLSEFRVLLEGENVKPIVQTKTGQKTVGARLQFKNADGSLFLLPYINFELDKYIYENEEDDRDYWTDEAIALGKKFLSSILALDNLAKSTIELSAKPDWLTHNKYVLPKEENIRNKLIEVENKINDLQKKKEKFDQEIIDESVLKRLLYENGKPLEAAIYIDLELLGFTVSQFKDSESEFDVVFESEEGRLIGEAEGKDNKAINIEKLRQLQMNILEDFARDEIQEMAKGALIDNAFRLSEPEQRGEFFTTKCLDAANRSSTALISTVDLFFFAKYLSGKNDKIFSRKCRKAIIETTGVITFPEIPIRGKEYKTIIDDKKDSEQ